MATSATLGTLPNVSHAIGTLPVANGGTGATTFTDGQLLIGNTSTNGLSAATLSAGSNVTITNGHGTISIAATTGAPTWTYATQSSTLNPAVLGTFYTLSGASFTITLPTAASVSGQGFFFQHNGTSLTQVYTFNTTSSQTINGAGGTVASGSYALYTNGERLWLISDGSNWQVSEHETETNWVSTGAAMAISSTSAYTFTIPSSSITAGTIYTNNGHTYTVSVTTGSSTSLACSGTGAPSASGTLTFVSGSPSGNLSFSSVATSAPAFGTNQNLVFYKREGQDVQVSINVLQTAAGTAGTGDLILYLPTNLAISGSSFTGTYINSVGTALNTVSAAYGAILPSQGGGLWNGTQVAWGLMPVAYSTTSFRVSFLFNSAGTQVASWTGATFALSNTAISFNLILLYQVSGWQP